jgi:hypothetical protein
MATGKSEKDINNFGEFALKLSKIENEDKN